MAAPVHECFVRNLMIDLYADPSQRTYATEEDLRSRPIKVTAFDGAYDFPAGWVLALQGSPPRCVLVLLEDSNGAFFFSRERMQRLAQKACLTIRAYIDSLPAQGDRRPPGDAALGGAADITKKPAPWAGDQTDWVGSAMIAVERTRQLSECGWSMAHDDEHGDGELARAAACYAMTDALRQTYHQDGIPILWPWEPESWKPVPDDRIRELVKAGALIAAEIDRLKRIRHRERDGTAKS